MTSDQGSNERTPVGVSTAGPTVVVELEVLVAVAKELREPCPSVADSPGFVLVGPDPAGCSSVVEADGAALRGEVDLLQGGEVRLSHADTVAPRRIQQRRTKGWRKPEGAVAVGRGTKWGNPYAVGGKPNGLACVPGAITGLDWEWEGRISAAGMQHDYFHPGGRVTRCTIRDLTREEAVLLYREALTGRHEHFREPRWAYIGRLGAALTIDDVRRELAGKDLMCWCPLDQPCHADVLLELANPTPPPSEEAA